MSEAFVIKAEVADPRATTFRFDARKTTYGGKTTAEGNTMFASENEGGRVSSRAASSRRRRRCRARAGSPDGRRA